MPSIPMANPPKRLSNFLEQTGMVITTYLHNETLKRKDVTNLSWVTNGITPWGGSLGVVTHYINTLGKKGMPSFPAALVNSLFNFFPVFRTVRTKNRNMKAIESNTRA